MKATFESRSKIRNWDPKFIQAFTQADGSDIRVNVRTRLGLNITKSIVECHDGHIHFDTGQHKGTVFLNYLQLLYQS